MARKTKHQGHRPKAAAHADPALKEGGSGMAGVHRPRGRTARIRRFVFRFSIAFVALLFLPPFFLLLIYKVETVKPVSTLMIHDALIGPGSRRDWVELDNISPHIVRSIMMSEDGQFCAHGGVDWTELNKVIDDALDGERTRGASTITMQLVKNLFLWPDRSFVRKALEVSYAIMTEWVLDKRRIMEIYLNIAEFDAGVFGVGAASQHYFKQSVNKLGPRNSARLAVTLPNPRGRNPAKPTRRLKALARTIQARARASGAYIKCIAPPK